MGCGRGLGSLQWAPRALGPCLGWGEALHLNLLSPPLELIAGLVSGCGLWGLDGVPRGGHAAQAP